MIYIGLFHDSGCIFYIENINCISQKAPNFGHLNNKLNQSLRKFMNHKVQNWLSIFEFKCL